MLPIYPLHGTEKVVNVESLAALQAHIYALGMRCCFGQNINPCKLLRYCGLSPYLYQVKVELYCVIQYWRCIGRSMIHQAVFMKVRPYRLVYKFL